MDGFRCPPYYRLNTINDVFFYIIVDNNDGNINVLDVVILINLILADDYDVIADMNGDGVVNILDIVTLINTILG